MNRLRMQHRASLSAAEREIDRIEVRRKKLIEMVMEGVPPSEVKDELAANAARREELKAKLAAADAPSPLLHPEMAELNPRPLGYAPNCTGQLRSTRTHPTRCS